jgi:hypothetical protein
LSAVRGLKWWFGFSYFFCVVARPAPHSTGFHQSTSLSGWRRGEAYRWLWESRLERKRPFQVGFKLFQVRGPGRKGRIRGPGPLRAQPGFCGGRGFGAGLVGPPRRTNRYSSSLYMVRQSGSDGGQRVAPYIGITSRPRAMTCTRHLITRASVRGGGARSWPAE